MCSEISERAGEDVDLIFPRRPFELMSRLQQPSGLGWPWHGLGIGSECGTMECSSLGQGVVNTP